MNDPAFVKGLGRDFFPENRGAVTDDQGGMTENRGAVTEDRSETTKIKVG